MKLLYKCVGLAFGLFVTAISPVMAEPYSALITLSDDWRQFEPPAIDQCLPDYSAAAMANKAQRLKTFQAQLSGLDRGGWTTAQVGDYQLVQAEMNGLDFDLRVLRPWARDPGFYMTVFNEQSDVPEHEGPSAYPAIDLYSYSYPLSHKDQKALTCLIGAVPALLAQARVNLAESNARDLWVYSARSVQDQSDTLTALLEGSLNMRTLEGRVYGNLEGVDPALVAAVRAAITATDAFKMWIEAEAPKKTGPSGVGKANYDWYMKNVHLVPYTWDDQVTLLRRELERSRAGLAMEEYRNRDLAPLTPVDDRDAYLVMAREKMQILTDFLIDGGLVEDTPYYRDALAQQVGDYTPPQDRNFFTHGMALDPSGLFSHDYHWIELARLKNEPNSSPIRRKVPLSDMYDSRSEGLATAMEEVLMQAGLYDNSPRSREIVWIMLANRAARGLASLYVQSNDMNLQQAGEFHARMTPRKWSDPNNRLVGFEQLLYLRQPGYGSSYVTGKLEFDRLISNYALRMEAEGKPFDLKVFFRELNATGVVPWPLSEQDMVPAPMRDSAHPGG